MPVSTLHVVFPDNWPGWSVSSYRMLSEDSGASELPSSSQHLSISVESEVHDDYGCDSPIFLSCSARRALKFAMRGDLLEDLRREAYIYEGPLAKLQGRSVPRCFGLFLARHPDNEDEEIGCLVLELCGGCIDRPFPKLNLDVRLAILERLSELHACGIHHADFAERNVLFAPDQDGGGGGNGLRIIDFDKVFGLQEECQIRPFVLGTNALPRSAEDVGCRWLWEICTSYLRLTE